MIVVKELEAMASDIGRENFAIKLDEVVSIAFEVESTREGLTKGRGTKILFLDCHDQKYMRQEKNREKQALILS